MKPRIGVFGAASFWENHAEDLARRVGELLAVADVTLVTGATAGLPLIAAKAALSKGATVLGISPGKNEREHLEVYKRPLEGYSEIVFTGMGFPLRNVLNAYNTDGAIALGGEIGTIQELCVCTMEGKVVGILEGSGGVSDAFRDLISRCKKDYGAEYIYSRDPNELVQGVVEAVRRRRG